MHRFTWNDEKRRLVRDKHGIDLASAIEIFAADHLILPARSETEERCIAIGTHQGVEIAVIFTMRGDICRVITARRARRNERQAYQAYLAGRSAAPRRQD